MKNIGDRTEPLYSAWHQAIASHQLINEFEASDDDPERRWVKGDVIVFGLKPKEGQPTYYAENRTQKQEIYGAVEEKLISDVNFTCQFNGYRALRPGGHRRSVGRQPSISEAPDQCRFYCQNHAHPLSLLIRAPLLHVPLQHFTWNAYYNAAPIEPEGHFLWIPISLDAPPNTLPHFPQRLTWPILDDSIRLFQCFKDTLLFFNSPHAGASVNHIHFQAMYHKHTLAAETCSLVQQGDYALLDGYPAHALVFTKETPSTVIFEWVNRFQQKAIPFNLMMVGQRIILIPRDINHEIVSEFPGNGLAALGMCGRIVTVDRFAYLKANADSIKSAFRKMVLPLN
jgi:hypothetical protein